MALVYNKYDKIWYGTEAEKDADTEAVTTKTAKCYTYGTETVSGILYVSDGTIWTLVE